MGDRRGYHRIAMFVNSPKKGYVAWEVDEEERAPRQHDFSAFMLGLEDDILVPSVSSPVDAPWKILRHRDTGAVLTDL